MNRYVMCRPEHFDVVSTLNPWMNPSVPVSRAVAIAQWEHLVDLYEALGHEVDLVQPGVGLPDMVFAANAGIAIDNRMMAAVMWSDERRPEEAHYRKHFDRAGFDEVFVPEHVNEGEGDFLLAGDVLLAGTGFRTDPRSHAEAQRFFDIEVVTLQLVDPRWYHLDTALFSINDDLVVWYPGAFDEVGVAELRRRFPDGIEATEADALAFGLNSTADSRHVVMPASASDLADRISRLGLDVYTVDLSELLKAGGSVKCCTLDLNRV
jgi:N-dimethylarginine dimethylaminohydrolase